MPDDMPVLPPRQDVSAAWLGGDLAKHPEKWIINLSPDHGGELEQAMAKVVSRGIEMADITKEIFTLPSLSRPQSPSRHGWRLRNSLRGNASDR